jgi:hypothetical protein
MGHGTVMAHGGQLEGGPGATLRRALSFPRARERHVHAPWVGALGIGTVLAQDNVVQDDGRDATEHLDLFVTDVLGPEGGRGLHGNQGQHLSNGACVHVCVREWGW